MAYDPGEQRDVNGQWSGGGSLNKLVTTMITKGMIQSSAGQKTLAKKNQKPIKNGAVGG